jgi:hypothetical protein
MINIFPFQIVTQLGIVLTYLDDSGDMISQAGLIPSMADLEEREFPAEDVERPVILVPRPSWRRCCDDDIRDGGRESPAANCRLGETAWADRAAATDGAEAAGASAAIAVEAGGMNERLRSSAGNLDTAKSKEVEQGINYRS